MAEKDFSEMTREEQIAELLKPILLADGTPMPDEWFEDDFPCICRFCQARRHAAGDHTYDDCV
jgi:hypothetical protein